MVNHAFNIYKKTEGVIHYTVSRYPARSYREGVRKRHLEIGPRQVYLAKFLGGDEVSVVNWEKDRYVPCQEYRRKLNLILGVP